MVQAVHTEAREAAVVRWDAPGDVFVWRARRCAEAVLYAVLHREGVDIDAIAKQRKGLDGLIEHKQLEGTLTRETRAQLKALQDFGNIAAHYQLTGGVGEDSVDAMGKLLVALLREFYTTDGGAPPDGLRPYLAALTDRQARIRSAAEIEGERAGQRVRELEARLRVVHVESAATPVAAPRGEASRRALILVGVAMVGGLGGYFVGRRDAATVVAAPVASPAPIPVPTTSREITSDAGTPTLQRPDAPPPQQLLAAPEVPCPPSMTRVGDGCVDPAPVLMREYRACVTADHCSRPQPGNGCNWQNSRDGLAANCVSWEEARQYCRWAHSGGGDLPIRTMWTVARENDVRLRHAPQTREWGVESGSGAALVGEALPTRTPSWFPTRSNHGLRDVSFRCAWTPPAASP